MSMKSIKIPTNHSGRLQKKQTNNVSKSLNGQHDVYVVYNECIIKNV
jgi:hypothetical protein